MRRWVILDRLIKRHGFTDVVELGVWKGKTLKYVVSKNPDINYTGVDLFSELPNNTEETYTPGENGHEWDHEAHWDDLSRFCDQHPNATLLRSDTASAVHSFDNESVDMVFVDASHDYESVKADIQAWLPIIRKGGIMAGHDYCENFPGVPAAVIEQFGVPTLLDDTVWMVRV